MWLRELEIAKKDTAFDDVEGGDVYEKEKLGGEKVARRAAAGRLLRLLISEFGNRNALHLVGY